MICQRNHLFKIFEITVLLFMSISALVAAERDDLYTEGMEDHSNQDHVEALKKLYAFYILNEVELKKRPEFEKKLKEKISTSEAILKLSFSTNPSVQLGEKHFRFIGIGGGSFSGTGKEIDDLLNNKAIDLKAIQELNHKALTMPSR